MKDSIEVALPVLTVITGIWRSDKRLDSLESRLDRMEDKITSRIDRVDESLHRFYRELGEHDGRLQALERVEGPSQ